FCRTDYLRRLGGFREEFFLYMEDVELCARVRRRGDPITIVPRAKAYHFEPPEGPVPASVEYHKLKNFVTTYLLHAPGRVLPEFACRYGLLAAARAALTDRRQLLLLLAAWGYSLGR